MTSLSDAELKRIVSKGDVLKVGDIVTCKEEHEGRYSITVNGTHVKIVGIYEDQMEVEVIDLRSEHYEYEFVVDKEHFELI